MTAKEEIALSYALDSLYESGGATLESLLKSARKLGVRWLPLLPAEQGWPAMPECG